MNRRKLFAFLGLTTVAAALPKAEAKPYVVPDLKGKVQANKDYGPIGIPIGCVMPWSTNANAVPPDNWLLCDGRAVSRLHYRELFTIIGTLYGGGDGHSTFNLPDMRPRLDIPDYSHSHSVQSIPFRTANGGVGGVIGAWGSPAPPPHQHTISEPIYTTGRYIGNGEYEAVAVHNHMQPTMVIQTIMRAL